MNNIIKKELSKITITQLNYDDNTTHIVIPKITKLMPEATQIGTSYQIIVSKSVTCPSENSTLASNWNNGKVPKYNEYYAEIIDKIPNMIKVNATSIENPGYNFTGWLPCNFVEIICKI